MNVFARWRPLAASEAVLEEIDRRTQNSKSCSLISVSIKRRRASSAEDRPWTSPAAFNTIFNPEDDNDKLYNNVVAPSIPKVLQGENCSFFAYGRSGSGKTHTVIGYDFQESKNLGLCLRTAKHLFDAFDDQNAYPGLGIGLSLFELRRKTAFDLLNKRTQCDVREGPDGKVHIRGETEMLQGGKVRVRPIVQQACWNFVSFQRKLVKALEQCATGSSSIHDESSRTYAFLQLEIVNQSLMDARNALFDRQSELVPVGKLATDIMVDEDTKSVIRGQDGEWVPNPDYQRDQTRINTIEAEKARFEARFSAAEEVIAAIIRSGPAPCLGAKMVFVDLAGAEYYEGNGFHSQVSKQTLQERQEGRQINTWSQSQKRIPFRASTLTMILREHFTSTGKGNSTIIVTVSPAAEQFAATLNSLKYASLVGAVKP
ncbi:kinesin family protein [Plenodomus tracheiphilus IPT5]|uniref:Kinesin family protein n=1 Tax=Plenodomus tracheiphilus IPT5 TaxID=1408161 RepID=A0A6A7AY77_9PLEO|nr:kinesin family protein [Plenodomus tracheiphilus IPT5]